jgi:hypothetical protein
MTRPFPRLVTDKGELVTETIPIPAEDSVEFARRLGMSEEEYRREMAMAKWMNDPEVKEALHRKPVVRQEDIDALAEFKRVCDAAGLSLREDGT